MRYLGGKQRIAKHIANYINQHNPNITTYYEPFCGMCSVGDLIKADFKYYSDAFKPIITLQNALLYYGWVPPDTVTEEEYLACKELNDPNDPLTAFIGFGCSFGGKYFGGYAKQSGKNFAETAKKKLLKITEKRKFPHNGHIYFTHCDYDDIYCNNKDKRVIYCDPPYKGTTSYKNDTKLNYEHFYRWCERASMYNNVYISEYHMPAGRFSCVLEINHKTTLAKTNQETIHRVEKLWTPKEQWQQI